MERQEDERKRVAALYRAHGLLPAWERVWDQGRDVTSEPPSTWPWPYSLYVSGGRGKAQQEDYLRWHAEAVAERLGVAPAEDTGMHD